MTEHDEAIRAFRRRLAVLLALRHALGFLALWAFLWGTAVLALRAAFGVPRPTLLWGLAAAPLALVPALLLAWRRLPPVSAVRALLDRHGACGGLLMAEEEVRLGQWRKSIPELSPPQLRWRGGRSWVLLAAAAGFVLLSFLLPQTLADLAGGPRLDVERDVETLGQQIDVLKEEKVVDAARADDLKDKLEQLRREARGRDPVKTLEALDHVQDVVKKAAREEAGSAARKNEELGRAEAMAEFLRKKTKEGGPDPRTLAEGMRELMSLTRKAGEGGALDKHLDKETLDALREGKGLSDRQMKELLDALRQGKGDVARKLAKLHKARLIDLETLRKCECAGECDCQGLAAYLKQNGGAFSLCDALAKCDLPGRGGRSRGPGAAPLTWKDRSTEEGVRFKEEALPPGALSKLKDSQRIAVGRGTPKAEPGGGPTGSGALSGAAAGGGSASTRVVLPRHRAAVERYFERPAGPKE